MFENRLMSLANVHDLLTREQWAPARLRDIVETEVSSFDGSRFDISGGDVQVEPQVASGLAMMLHELGTNAVKYGALSNGAGRIRIEWQTERQGRRYWLRLHWREVDGPPMTPPGKEGFGLKLIKRAITAERGASVEYSFHPAGVTCTAHLPIEEILPR